MRLSLILLTAGVVWGASHSYHTTFPLTENPISENSQWVGGSTAGGSLWGNVRTTTNRAFGVSLPTQFGDPTALLTGTWGANQTVQGTVVSTNPTGNCCHEIELRLRMTISTNSISGYEAYCSVMPDNLYCHIARWNGPNGSYCNIESSTPSTFAANGDVLKATVTGTSTTVVTLFKNGTQISQATDTGQSCSPGGAGGPFTSGAPGIGFFDNQDNTWTAMEYSDFWATDGVPVMDTTTATSITASGATSGGTVVNNGGTSITDEGVGVSTVANPTSPCTGSGTSTPFTTNLSGLLASTLYHYRSCATNSSGTGYGPDLTFTTGASTATTKAIPSGSSVRGGNAVH